MAIDIFDAAEYGDVEDVKYFVEEKGVSVNVVKTYYLNETFETPLHLAMVTLKNPTSIVKIVQYLLAQGANIHAINTEGNTPLHYAAVFGSPVEVFRILVSYGADVNKINKNGWTPLHYAAERKPSESSSSIFSFDEKMNDVEIIKYLISQDADVNLKTAGLSGKTPFDLAETDEKKRILHEAMECITLFKEKYEKERIEREKAEAEGKALFEKILPELNQAIERNPNDAEAFRLRGEAYAQRKDYNRAIDDYDKAIKIDSNDAESYAFRGAAYSEKHEQDKAMLDFNEAIRLNPNCKNAYWFRGALYGTKGEHDKSISDYEEALRIDPNDKTTNNLLENAQRNKIAEEEKKTKERKRSWKVLLLCYFLGWLGVHRFYLKKTGTGILYLATLGLFGIGVYVDMFRITYGKFDNSVKKASKGGKIFCWISVIVGIISGIIFNVFYG